MPASNINITTAQISEATVTDGYEDGEGNNQDVTARVSGVLELDIENSGLMPVYVTSVNIKSIRAISESGSNDLQIVGNESIDGYLAAPLTTMNGEVRFYADQSIDDYDAYSLLLDLGDFICKNNQFEVYIDYTVNALLNTSSNTDQVMEIVDVEQTSGDYCEAVQD